MSRWISLERPSVLSRSRRLRGRVLPGSMLYSAVAQPRPSPAIQSGTRSSTLAVQRTMVRPLWISTLPGADLVKPRVMVTGRSSLSWRLLFRMMFCVFGERVSFWKKRKRSGVRYQQSGVSSRALQPSARPARLKPGSY